MSAQIITTDDLREFKTDLLEEIKKIMKPSSEPPKKKWIKSPEVRQMLGISPGTLQNLRINGTLPYARIGGILYYDVEVIDKMLLNQNANYQK